MKLKQLMAGATIAGALGAAALGAIAPQLMARLLAQTEQRSVFLGDDDSRSRQKRRNLLPIIRDGDAPPLATRRRVVRGEAVDERFDQARPLTSRREMHGHAPLVGHCRSSGPISS